MHSMQKWKNGERKLAMHLLTLRTNSRAQSTGLVVSSWMRAMNVVNWNVVEVWRDMQVWSGELEVGADPRRDLDREVHGWLHP